MNTTDPKLRQAALAGGAVVAAFFAILLLRWVYRQVFTGSGALLVVIVAACVVGYLYIRSRNPRQARQWESRLRNNAQSTIAHIGTPSVRRKPVPANTYSPVLSAQSTDSAGLSGALISALLLIPSLIAYGVVYGGHTAFSSAWQPWWILTGLNIYLIVCAGVRSRTGRGTLAALFGVAGAVLYGLATSPLPDVSLTGLLSQKHYSGGYTYSAPPDDLLPWINRAPTLALILFVVAWGISRRRNRGWAAGLIPAALLVALAIWYTENHYIGEAGWFGWWLTGVGVFVAGSLACWLFDAMGGPREGAQPLPTRSSTR